MPLPLLAATLGAATLGAAAAPIGRGLATAFSPVARAENKAQREDIKKLQSGVDLGTPEAEKSAGIAASVQAAQAAQAGLIDEARRRGDFTALTKMSEQAARTGAGARLGQELGSQQLAQQRTADIRARMAARRQEVVGGGAQAGQEAAKVLVPATLMAGGKGGLTPEEASTIATSAYG